LNFHSVSWGLRGQHTEKLCQNSKTLNNLSSELTGLTCNVLLSYKNVHQCTVRKYGVGFKKYNLIFVFCSIFMMISSSVIKAAIGTFTLLHTKHFADKIKIINFNY